MPGRGDESGRELQENRSAAGADMDDYPVREYVGSMSRELARLSRLEGDEVLAALLDVAVLIANQPISKPNGAGSTAR
jgi:hypothetical protein